MEQKGYIDYEYEIVNQLMKGPNHIRGMAKNLGVNHMTISRSMTVLAKRNVVDYSLQGKNKNYFIKITTEARNYVLSAEIYKLSKFLAKYADMRGLIEGIIKDRRFKLAVLFGSYAKGTAKDDSDIDIYIETKEKKIREDISLLNSKLSVKIGEYDKDNLLIKEIEKNHIIIKGFEEYYEKRGIPE